MHLSCKERNSDSEKDWRSIELHKKGEVRDIGRKTSLSGGNTHVEDERVKAKSRFSSLLLILTSLNISFFILIVGNSFICKSAKLSLDGQGCEIRMNMRMIEG